MKFAVRTRDSKIIHHVMGSIIRLDRLLTLPGAIILAVAGLGAAMHGKLPIFHTGWILLSILLFLFSGFLFSARLAPLQRKIHMLTLQRNEKTTFDWDHFNLLYRRWRLLGWMAILSPLLAFVMMMLKFPG
jgi:uncharacterized membrane protein